MQLSAVKTFHITQDSTLLYALCIMQSIISRIDWLICSFICSLIHFFFNLSFLIDSFTHSLCHPFINPYQSYYRETWPGSSLSSRRAPCRTNNGYGRGANLRTPAPQAATLPKELSRQLISWIFRASTWPSPTTTFGPLQYCNFTFWSAGCSLLRGEVTWTFFMEA